MMRAIPAGPAMSPPEPSHPPAGAYAWYLAGSSLWIAGMSLQGFLFTWMLVGILGRPAGEVGLARALAEFPPLLLLFVAGVLGDRLNGRSYLAWMHALAVAPPLLLAAVGGLDALDFVWVLAFGVLMSGIQALSDPARQSVLSRVTRLDTQPAIAVMTVCTSLVGLAGFYVGGYVEGLGLPAVLVLQSIIFAAGLAATLRLPSLPITPRREDQAPGIAAMLLTGLRAVWRHRTIRDLTAFNLLSSLFNAGAYIIVVPFIVKELYAGDAGFFATVMIVFTTGSIGSNVLLLAFMPIARPGRLFLLMQPVRAVLLVVLFFQPPTWLFLVVMFVWGLNIGVATTLVRTTVQELAAPAVRSQILSILLVSFLVASPVSALLLGEVVEAAGPSVALLPGVAVSLFIFCAGILGSPLWRERSPEARLR
jgi:hypothetical protein